MMTLYALLMVLCVGLVVTAGGSIIQKLLDNEHYILATMFFAITIFAAVVIIYLAELNYKQQNTSNSEIIKMIVYTADGDILAKYEGCISNILYNDDYIKFKFNNNEYFYQNCLVEMIEED